MSVYLRHEPDIPFGVGNIGLRGCSWFCLGSIETRGRANLLHESGAEAILSFENLLGHLYRYTLAYDRKMSYCIALAASCFRSWAVSLSRDVSAVAITTVPATCLERPLLGVSPSLCSIS